VPARRHSPLFTAIVVLVVGAAGLYAQVKTRGGWGYGGAWRMQLFYFHGWPAKALSRTVTETLDSLSFGAFSPKLTTTSEFDWSLVGVFVNVVSLVLLLGGTAVACELLRRRPVRAWQFNIRDLLAGITIAAVLLTLYQNEIWLSWRFSEMLRGSSLPWNARIGDLPWYVQVPILFGVGCVIFSAGWMATKLPLALRRRVGV
jgi:hypothetical protein